jgi:hypothetical protein
MSNRRCGASADGMGHPGTFHFRSLVEEVSNGV